MASGKSNCRSKYCPALVAMLRTVGRMRNKEICALLDMKPSAVYNIIHRHGLADSKYLRKSMISDIEREYLAGYSSYELAEKYGVHSGTIRKWMRDLGHVKGKDQSTELAQKTNDGDRRKKGAKKGHETQLKNAITKLENKLIEQGGKVSLVEFGNNRSTYKCNTCGCVFSRARDTRGDKINCPECKQREYEKLKQQRIEDQKRHESELLAEYEKDKECAHCGGVFHNERKEAKYCSIQCRRNARKKRRDARLKQSGRYVGRDSCHRKRARKFGVPYDSSITWRSLSKKLSHCNCEICGKPCDPNDNRYGYIGPLYPSVDCIIPMAKGGGYVYGNVQLAHHMCNSYLRDLMPDEVSKEVITHAKEQAIAYKCA